MPDNEPNALTVPRGHGLQQPGSRAEKVVSRVIADALVLARARKMDFPPTLIRGGGGNIADKPTTNSLTFAGKIWTMHHNGNSKVLKRKIAVLDDDGNPTGEYDLENVQTVRLIVLDWNTQTEQAYYEKGYDATAGGRAPDCWSPDGKKPHASVEERQGATCELCPKAAKGSKIVDGVEKVACGRYRNLAVIPARSLDFPALRLRLAQTSDFDSRDEEAMSDGWYAWKPLTEFLKANNLPHTAFAIIKVRFATGTPAEPIIYPKLQFHLDNFVPEDKVDFLLDRAKSEEVRKLLSGFTPSNNTPKGRPLPKDDDDGVATAEKNGQ